MESLQLSRERDRTEPHLARDALQHADRTSSRTGRGSQPVRRVRGPAWDPRPHRDKRDADACAVALLLLREIRAPPDVETSHGLARTTGHRGTEAHANLSFWPPRALEAEGNE